MQISPERLYRTEYGYGPFKFVDYDYVKDLFTIRYVSSGKEFTMSYDRAMKCREYEGEYEMTTKTLYEVNEKFAHKLAVNSKGEWVMEEKGTGTVFTADPKACEEVVPYTVDIKFQGNGSTYSYTSKEGKFSVGDLLWMPDSGYGESFARVVAVGTKSKKATKELTPIGKFVLDTSWKD